MKFMVNYEADAAIFAYMGFELLSVSYDVTDSRKQFVFEITDTAKTCAREVTNDPVKLLDDWQSGEFTISDGRELIAKYQSLVHLIIQAKQKAIAGSKRQKRVKA
jgi:hypothetical protein